MSNVVLDASALMAFLRNEPGSDKVEAVLEEAMISSVNFSEVLAKATEIPDGFEAAKSALRGLRLHVVPFDEQQAEIAGGLRLLTHSLGLSLGDRCCLALALSKNLSVMTIDREWSKLQIGIDIDVVR